MRMKKIWILVVLIVSIFPVTGQQASFLTKLAERLPRLPSSLSQIELYYLQMDKLMAEVDRAIEKCDQQMQQTLVAAIQNGTSFSVAENGKLPSSLIQSIEKARNELSPESGIQQKKAEYINSISECMNKVWEPMSEAESYWEQNPDISEEDIIKKNAFFQQKIFKALDNVVFAPNALLQMIFREKLDFMIREFIPREQLVASAESQYFQSEIVRKCFAEKRGLEVLKEELSQYRNSVFEVLKDGKQFNGAKICQYEN